MNAGCSIKMHWFSTDAGGIDTCRQLRNEKKKALVELKPSTRVMVGAVKVRNVNNIFQKHAEILDVVWLLSL